MYKTKTSLIFAGLLTVCGMISGCATPPSDSPSGADPAKAAAAPQSTADFGAVNGKNWKLSRISAGGKVITIDRLKFEADGVGGYFTISFGERVNGQAAPNTYMGPYQTGDNNSLTIGMLAGTLMMGFYDTGELKENGYFKYLEKVKSWKLNGEALELRGPDSDGTEIVLYFVL